MEKSAINILVTMASIFGFYTSYRLYSIRRKHLFYITWLILESCFFFCYFLLKNEMQFLSPILLEIFTTIFYLSSGFFYISITVISNNKKSIQHYLLALSPLIIIGFIKIVILGIYHDHTYNRIHLYNISINTSSFISFKDPFLMEKILFLFRHIVTAMYLQMIDRMLKNKPNVQINKSWEVIFRPFRMSVYFIGIIIFAQLTADNIFKWKMSDYFFINAVMSFSAIMYFWHLSLLLKDLENPESIFRGGHKPIIPLTQLPEKTLFILKQICEQKMYENPLLSVASIANKFNMSEEKFAAEFNNNSPFSFSSYINYLRLINFEKNSKSNYSKETNILNAGFNSRVSYYQWEKRRNKLAQQIDPILRNIEQ